MSGFQMFEERFEGAKVVGIESSDLGCTMVATRINGRWDLLLPSHRAARPEWPWWEAARIAAMADLLRPGDVVLDVGAEEGDMSALWASWGCRVILVEPNPKAWPCIRATFEANRLMGQVDGWYVGLLSDHYAEAGDGARPEDAVWSRVSRESFRWPDCAYDQVVPDHGFQHIGEHEPVTPTWTADALLDFLGVRPTAVTMDVEGGEGHVLRGMPRLLSQPRPRLLPRRRAKVWVSVHPEIMLDLYDTGEGEVYGIMERAGYDRWFLARDHEVHEMFLPAEDGWGR